MGFFVRFRKKTAGLNAAELQQYQSWKRLMLAVCLGSSVVLMIIWFVFSVIELTILGCILTLIVFPVIIAALLTLRCPAVWYRVWYSKHRCKRFLCFMELIQLIISFEALWTLIAYGWICFLAY